MHIKFFFYKALLLSCLLIVVQSFAKEESIIKLTISGNEQHIKQLTESITELIYIKPKVKQIHNGNRSNRAHEFSIDKLSHDKALIIAAALQEKLRLKPEIIERPTQNKRISQEPLIKQSQNIKKAFIQNHTSIIQLKKVNRQEETFNNAFSESSAKQITKTQPILEKSQQKTKENLEKKATQITAKEENTSSKAKLKTSMQKATKDQITAKPKKDPKPTQLALLTLNTKTGSKPLSQPLAKVTEDECAIPQKTKKSPLSDINKALLNSSNATKTTYTKGSLSASPKTPSVQKKDLPVKHLWNAQDADIRGVIKNISALTHKNFIIDPRVNGKITIIAKTPLSVDEIYAAFLSALQVNGYAAIETQEATKIVPNIEAKSLKVPVKRDESEHSEKSGDSYLVRVVSIKHVPVQQLIPVLRPLMPQWDILSTYMPSNKIILSGRKSNLDKLIKIIQEVDTDYLQNITIVPIQYGLADEMAKTLKAIYTNYEGLAHRITIATDDNSNSVLISGAPADRIRIKALIAEMDNPTKINQHASTQVIYLKYLQAKDIVPILAGVAKSMFSGPVGTTIGAMTVENAERVSIDAEGTPLSHPDTNNKSETVSKSESIKGESGRSVEIIGEPNTNAIIINGPPNVLQTLRHVIHQIDIRPAQIIVEALIAEINEDEVTQLGIDWGTVVNNTNMLSTAATGFQKNIGIITKSGFEDFQAILRALAEDNKANILSTPSVMVLDNHKAHIAVGNEVSIEQSQYFNNNNTPTSTFTRKKVALVLDVTPQINQGEAIRLLLSHANNTLQNQSDTSGRPIFNVNEINTSVIVNNGDVLVLGGLIKNEVHQNDKQVPLLGHLPIIGRAFHNKSKNVSRRKLMVFLHPLIIKNHEDSNYFSNQKYDFMREAQLNFMNQFEHHPKNQEYVLPRKKILTLPKPFRS